MNEYTKKLLTLIPGGAHTYSRGYDQFPSNAPAILKRGKGAYIYDVEDREYLDYGMALRSVILGYADEYVNKFVIENAIKMGNNLTRPSIIELQAAELFVNLIPSVEMVKFAKNGSNVTTAAVKLARAYTGRDLVARCVDHPFFSFDDWFIGSTVMDKGVPKAIKELTKTFKYGDLKDLERLFDEYPNQIACVIMEPATTHHPPQNYLQKVKELCHKNGALFILDEMVTGFRWHLKGAQFYYNVEPDLCTFGKAMANGFSLAALGGKREIMKLGSIEFEGQERVFLLSTTHGAEMSALAAFIATLKIMEEKDVINHIWNYGKNLIKTMNDIAKEYGISDYFKAEGVECSPYYTTLDKNKENSYPLRTLFNQEMIKKGVFMPWIALSMSHKESELEKTAEALKHALKVYALALEDGWEKYLEGHIIKPVFRKYN
ncbi:glutamate-1-semialdehyde 2,1-aminomutase [Dissulfurispira thermophila]|uniref:Glutamate-1-semialdehyde 2,1-aminomutase n=1 Tax=Dissulfurispira thermophila TaxID=2715679 RepID=A0A7G1H151_9BACT|nr:glutamate-1-semialdehyde 2,1-aminomutase [Dissulfurispira thermophila]BCB96328.1 glutamate-1-semialdehyde 2,1-aminomutase [Dissulfurispira thermophila]